MITEELKKLYITHTGHEPESIDELPSSGSRYAYADRGKRRIR